MILRDGIDEVVTVGSATQNKVAHIPDNGGKPLCGARPRTRQVNNRPKYNVKDRNVVPHHDICKHCKDRVRNDE